MFRHLAVLTIGVLFLIITLVVWRHTTYYRSWDLVEAKLTNFECHEKKSDSDNRDRKYNRRDREHKKGNLDWLFRLVLPKDKICNVKAVYTYEGKRYESVQYEIAMQDEYESIYVNPEEPQEVMIYDSSKPLRVTLGIFSMILLTCGSLGLFFAKRRQREEEEDE